MGFAPQMPRASRFPSPLRALHGLPFDGHPLSGGSMNTNPNPTRPGPSLLANPWTQLVIGVICMACVANMQYGWTLFVNPIDAKYHWGVKDIQVAFTLFVLIET